MRKLFYLLAFFCTSFYYAQTNGITYQAVIYLPNGQNIPGQDIQNSPMTNRLVCLQFSLIDDLSQLEYQETIQTTTDEFGMVNLLIGSGTQTGGYASSFNAVLWNNTRKSLKVELDALGNCQEYIVLSDNPLSAVPFAYAAVTANNVSGIVAILNGGTGASNLAGAKINLQIDNVDNTSDAAKPISTATQTALDAKENALNKSNTTTLGTSDVLYPTQNAVKTYVDNQVTNATIPDANAITKGKIQLAGDLSGTAAAPTVPALATKENAANKSSTPTLGTSDVFYPTQNAVKTYVDTQVASATIPDADATTKGKIQLTGDLSGTAAAPTVPALATKENTANKSTVTTLGTSDDLFPTQNAVKTYVDTNISTVNANNTALQATVTANATAATNAIAAVQTDVDANETASNLADTVLQTNINTLNSTVTSNAAATTTALGLKEDSINKSNTTTLGTSDDLFPTQNAVKTYVDTNISTVNANNTALQAIVTANANAANNAIAIVQADVDANEITSNAADVTLQDNINTLQNTVTTNASNTTSNLALKENTANKSTVTTLGASDDLFPTQNAVKTYVDTNISTVNANNAALQATVTANATAATNAIAAVQNDVDANETASNTALALKEDADNKTLDLTTVDGTSDIKFPSAKATKDYVDLQISTGVVDASTTVKGKIQLAGDLGGTAALPEVATGAITSAKLADDSVSTIKIIDAAVTDVKLASGIDATKLADGSVTNTELQYIGTITSNVQTQINGLNSDIATNTSNIATNTTNIATNTTNIATNTAAIATNTTDIATNTTDIATNASNITANTAAIATNTTDIATNATNIAANTSAIATNTSNIATNTTDIASNTAAIITNTTDITANTAAIATNTTDIATNTTDIAANTAAIATNNTDIATNTTDIATLKTLESGKIYVGNASNEATQVRPAGDVTITNTGVTTIANDAVTTAKITDANVTSTKLADDAVETAKIKNANVTYAKIQNVSATDKVLGRVSTGAGVIEEISTTGSGNVVRATSPTLVTPDLGVPSAIDLTYATGLPIDTAVTGILDVANGGTGSATKNFVDLTENQTIGGIKDFTSNATFNGQSIGKGNATGGENLAVGAGALNAVSTGHRNTAIGYSAMQNYVGTSFDNNTSVGYGNLVALTTGSGNTSVGAESMMALTTGTENTSIGNQSLINTTGSNNVGVGKRSGDVNTTGNNNTIIGTNANLLADNLNNATALGYGAVVGSSDSIQLGNTDVTSVNTSGKLTTGAVTYPNTDGTANQVLLTNGSGVASFGPIPTLNQNTTGTAANVTGTVAIANGGTGQTTKTAAFDALSPMTTAGDIIYGGTSGTGTRLAKGTDGQVLTLASGLPSWVAPTGVTTMAAIGSTPNANGASISGVNLNLQPANASFGGVVTTGVQTFAGVKTFSSDISVNENKFGRGAGSSGSRNIAIGINPLAANTSGTFNTAIGAYALESNTTSSNNTAIGNNALKNATGSSNTAVGSNALLNATTGIDNTAIGKDALQGNTTGSNNIGIGVVAGANTTTGDYNISIGKQALQQNILGSSNIAVGAGAIDFITTGNNNTVLGGFAGRYAGTGFSTNTTTLNNSLLLGYDTRPKLNNDSNEIVIGNSTVGNGSNTTTIGNTATTDTYIYGNLNITGQLKVNNSVLSKSTTYTFQTSDNANLLVFTGSTTGQTITLPSAVTVGAGREITIKNIASVSVSIASAGGTLISDSTTTGATSLSIGIEPSNNWIKAISDGANWIILRALF